MKRPIRVLLLVLFAAVIALAAAACGNTGGEEENQQSGTGYTVTFDSNGGSAVAAVKVTPSKKITEPAVPTKAGYAFSGWYKERGLENRWDFSSDTVTRNITLYAKWVALSGEDPVDGTGYTVTFDSNGGSAVTAVKVRDGKKIAEPTVPTKAGYAFGGWYKESGFNNLWDFSSDTVTRNITLYAKWEALSGEDPVDEIGYTVTFNSNGGSAVTAVDVTYGGKITAPAAPTKAGYAFKGWYKEIGLNNLWDFSSDTVTGNITLYAKWEELPGTEGLTYALNSGSSYSVTGYTGNTKDIIIPAKYNGLPVTSIANDVFKEKSITSVIIPSGVTSIGERAFASCSVLSSVVFVAGSKLESIGGYAFYYCRSLEGIEIPAGVTSIVSYAFYECSALNSVVFGADSKLESIGSYAFYNCYRLAGIEIPTGVASIGGYAFTSCIGLASIEIPASVTSIGSWAFEYCYNLVIHARAASQPSGWASSWHGLRPVYWGINGSNYYEDGEGVKYVIEGGRAILTRAPLSVGSITIPNSITIGSSVYSVTSIGEYAFCDCDSLASIEIPAGVTSIGYGAFTYCASLVSIEIPAGVTSIGYQTFYDCTSLSSVVFGAGSKLESIGDYAFCSCDSLKSVTMNSVMPPELGSNAFSFTPSDMKIYVPSGSEATYKSASGWSYYSSRIIAKA